MAIEILATRLAVPLKLSPVGLTAGRTTAAAGGEISYPSTCVVRRTMYCVGPTPGAAGVLPANVKVPTTVDWDGRTGSAIFISTYGLRYLTLLIFAPSGKRCANSLNTSAMICERHRHISRGRHLFRLPPVGRVVEHNGLEAQARRSGGLACAHGAVVQPAGSPR